MLVVMDEMKKRAPFVQDKSLISHYHRNLVPAAKPCWIFTKFGIGVLYINVSNKHEFHENNGSESYILLSGVKEFLPVVSDQFRSNMVQMTFT
jgi:hypothetical protein